MWTFYEASKAWGVSVIGSPIVGVKQQLRKRNKLKVKINCLFIHIYLSAKQTWGVRSQPSLQCTITGRPSVWKTINDYHHHHIIIIVIIIIIIITTSSSSSTSSLLSQDSRLYTEHCTMIPFCCECLSSRCLFARKGCRGENTRDLFERLPTGLIQRPCKDELTGVPHSRAN